MSMIQLPPSVRTHRAPRCRHIAAHQAGRVGAKAHIRTPSARALTTRAACSNSVQVVGTSMPHFAKRSARQNRPIGPEACGTV